MVEGIYTIGLYGFSEERFHQALREAGINVFCDLRQWRQMRGAKYAFANAKALEIAIASRGIRYVHCKELAPASDLRDIQRREDARRKVRKRDRPGMAKEFVRAYNEKHLDHFYPAAFIYDLGADAKKIALFCVETDPMACHRSLVADRLKYELEIPVEHLRPPADEQVQKAES